jgi:DTW domain-containing protein YfiP
MSRARCARCLRPETHCLCALIPQLDSRTRVLILQHPSEVNHALNTARLAALGLNNAELIVGEVFDDLPALLNPSGYQARVLFPADDAQPLMAYRSEGCEAGSTSMLLVVPDGTWRKARKLLHLNPLLAALPRVTLAHPVPSRYRLRKAPGPGALSTVEAIVQALQTLEAPKTFEALLRPFEALIDGQISAMGEDTYQRNHL